MLPAELTGDVIHLSAAPLADSPAPAPSLASTGRFPSKRWVIFGSSGGEVPCEARDLLQRPLPKPIPSERFVVTPALEAYHAQNLGGIVEDANFNQEVGQFLAPLIANRYGQARNQAIAELGPSVTTQLATATSHPSNRYVAVDGSEPLLEYQMGLLADRTASSFFSVKGDTYNLPLKPESVDLVMTSCHPPFVSSSVDDRKLALDQVHQALKPGGEFVLFPYHEKEQPAEFRQYLSDKFEMIERHSSPAASNGEREALILRKRG